MNKKIIWIVSVCMGLAMTALILVQAFWLKNAWLVKEKQFDQLISRSMIDIERQIERHEATDLIVRENERQAQGYQFIFHLQFRVQSVDQPTRQEITNPIRM